MHKRNRSAPGFTIVELLIVVVVIAILAALSVVAYTGFQSRAHTSAVRQDMRNFAQKVLVFHADTGRYPQSEADLRAVEAHFSKSSYDLSANALMYCYAGSGVTETFAVAGKPAGSGSKGVFYSLGSGSGDVTTWYSTGAELRPQIGCSGAGFGSWGYGGSGVWRSWAN